MTFCRGLFYGLILSSLPVTLLRHHVDAWFWWSISMQFLGSIGLIIFSAKRIE